VHHVVVQWKHVGPLVHTSRRANLLMSCFTMFAHTLLRLKQASET
jgi:hypothetical protein